MIFEIDFEMCFFSGIAEPIQDFQVSSELMLMSMSMSMSMLFFFDFFEKIGMLMVLLCFFSGIAEPNQDFQVSRFK